jgi:hypothetical protein
MPAIEPDRLYRVNELIEILRCSKTNAYDLITRGDIRRTSVGSRGKGFRVRGSEILRFLEARGHPDGAVDVS